MFEGARPTGHNAVGFQESISHTMPVCTPLECLQTDPELAELTADDEHRLEVLGESIDTWNSELNDARGSLRMLIGGMDVLELSLRRRLSSTGGLLITWPMSSGSYQGDKANAIAKVRTDTISDIQSRIAQDSDDKTISEILTSNDIEELQRVNKYLREQLDTEFEGSKKSFPLNAMEGFLNPYYRLFLAELQARTDLAICAIESPELARQVFLTDHGNDLPDSMRDFIAIDLLAGKDSILRRVSASQADEILDLFDYLGTNNLSTAAKEMAMAIGLGTKALGGCVCPLNDAGICKTAADAIDREKLPHEIQSDMQRKREEATKLGESNLIQQRSVRQISPNWSFHTSAPPRKHNGTLNAGKQSGRLNRGSGITMKGLERNATEQIKSREIILPSLLKITVRGEAEMYEAGFEHEDDVVSVISTVLQSKLIQDFVKRHPGQHLESALELAVGKIVNTADYRAEKALLPLSGARVIKSDIDDARLTQWRLSGGKMATGIGKLGRDMRVYFAISNKNNTRRIEISKVVHKDDVKNFKRGSLPSGVN